MEQTGLARTGPERTRPAAFIATPAPAGAAAGNRITALRWAKRLRELGWRVQIATQWAGEPCDLLVALHAHKSHASLARHATEQPGVPRVLALTGTDLYEVLLSDVVARESLALAARIVVLQPLAVRRLPEPMRDRARVIWQSATAAPLAPAPPAPPLAPAPPVALLAPTAPALPLAPAPPAAPAPSLAPAPPELTVCVLAHLRDVKDPLLAARAASLVPASSRLRIVHLGGAPDEAWGLRARDAERATSGRWTWLGARPRAETLRVLGGSRLLVLTSRSEGGANVVTEAIAAGVPVLSTQIEGSLGILGEAYPGYFEVGDAEGLAKLLGRCADEPGFLEELRGWVTALRPLIDPAVERNSWRSLLRELGLAG